MQGARIGADAAQLPISRQARSYPETGFGDMCRSRISLICDEPKEDFGNSRLAGCSHQSSSRFRIT